MMLSIQLWQGIKQPTPPEFAAFTIASIFNVVISPFHKHILLFGNSFPKASISFTSVITLFFNSSCKYSFSIFKYSSDIGFTSLILHKDLYSLFLDIISSEIFSTFTSLFSSNKYFIK